MSTSYGTWTNYSNCSTVSPHSSYTMAYVTPQDTYGYIYMTFYCTSDGSLHLFKTPFWATYSYGPAYTQYTTGFPNMYGDRYIYKGSYSSSSKTLLHSDSISLDTSDNKYYFPEVNDVVTISKNTTYSIVFRFKSTSTTYRCGVKVNISGSGRDSECLEILEYGAPTSCNITTSGLSTWTDSSGTEYKYVKQDSSSSAGVSCTITSAGYPTPTNYITYDCGHDSGTETASTMTAYPSAQVWSTSLYFRGYCYNGYALSSGSYYLYTDYVYYKCGYAPSLSGISSSITINPASPTISETFKYSIYGPYVKDSNPKFSISSSNTNVVTATITEYTNEVGLNKENTHKLTWVGAGTATVTIKCTDVVYGTTTKTIAVTCTDTPDTKISVSDTTVDIGGTITITNQTTTYSSPTTYTWLVDSSSVPEEGESGTGYTVVSKSDEKLVLYFFDNGSYTVSLKAESSMGYSKTVSQNLYVLSGTESQVTRYKVVLFDSSRKCLVITRNYKGPLFYELEFEKRLDECGQGSMRVFVPNGYDTYLLQQNTQLIIFDEMIPIYCGVLTSVTQVNNAMYGKSVKCGLYDIEFEDAIRNQTYEIISSSKSQTNSTVSTIVNNILRSELVGTVSSDSTNYNFNESSQSRLSLLESFSNQCGFRYRTRPNIVRLSGTINEIGINADSSWDYANKQVKVIVNNLIDGVYTGDIIFGYGEDWLFCCVVTSISYSTQYVTVDYANGYTINMAKDRGSDESPITLTYIHANNTNGYIHYLIDFCESYYDSDDPVYTFTINENTYDVDEDEKLYNHYGKVVCYSPQSSGYNIYCPVLLNNVVNSDSSIDGEVYITQSYDTIITDSYYSDGYQYITLEGYGWPTETLSEIWCTCGGSSVIYINTLYYVKSGTYSRTYRYTASSEYGFIYGDRALYGKYVLNEDIDYDSYVIQINGITFVPSSVSTSIPYYTKVGDKTIQVRHKPSSISGTALSCLASRGNIVLCGHVLAGSPRDLYGDNTYTYQLQDGLTGPEVAYMTTKIVKFGSNQTANVTGESSVTLFQKKNTEFGSYVPLDVGDRVEFSKGTNDDDTEYELIAYTIHADEMTVEYEAGIKTKNIGDVVYTINSNMSTNIN